MNNNQPNDDFVPSDVFISAWHTVMSFCSQLNSRVKTLEEIHDIQSNVPNEDSNAVIAASGGRRRKNRKKSRRRRRRRKRRTRR